MVITADKKPQGKKPVTGQILILDSSLHLGPWSLTVPKDWARLRQPWDRHLDRHEMGNKSCSQTPRRKRYHRQVLAPLFSTLVTTAYLVRQAVLGGAASGRSLLGGMHVPFDVADEFLEYPVDIRILASRRAGEEGGGGVW